MFNRFARNTSMEMGAEKTLQSGCKLSPIMCHGLKTAIPIWEMLCMTEEAYMEKQYKQFATDASDCDFCEPVLESK